MQLRFHSFSFDNRKKKFSAARVSIQVIIWALSKTWMRYNKKNQSSILMFSLSSSFLAFSCFTENHFSCFEGTGINNWLSQLHQLSSCCSKMTHRRILKLLTSAANIRAILRTSSVFETRTQSQSYSLPIVFYPPEKKVVTGVNYINGQRGFEMVKA